MQAVTLKLDDNGRGDFFIMDGSHQLGKMEFSVSGNFMTVYHTYVMPEEEGKGFAKKLMAAMIDYIREKKLEVIPVCSFVRTQFIRHSEKYPDVWHREKPGNQIKSESGFCIFN